MKKIILSFALLLCMCVGAFAQTKVVANGPIGIDWKFKRSFMNGTTLVVDLVMENNTGKDVRGVVTYSFSSKNGMVKLKAYDDEGNVYPGNAVGENKFSGKMGSVALNNWETIPKNNLVKIRLQIADIDEYATLLKTLIVPVMIMTNGTSGQENCELKVTNIPIPRE